ncbi:trypsin-like [Bradysia coprophila]|uniref:trypsin-like n=1 Tax=Bradysia coprophila TaxID=38358 RepID=UPI00187DCA84|nr:trypsin-like [Bradysia coprophila]
MKAKLFFLTLSLIVLLHGLVQSDKRIYGGYRVDITEAPYMVSIIILIETYNNGTSKVHECGGSILKQNLILTAAHCNVDESTREPYSAERFYVNVGTNRNDLKGGTVHRVKTVFVHPKFRNGDENYRFHDIGLLQLKDDITLNDKSQLVKLARRGDKPKIGADCTITGYGKNPDHPGNKFLYQVHLNVITAEQCVDELASGTVEEVEKHNICVKAEGKNQCRGDSGGPVHDVSTNRQVGIVSYGAEDCTSDSPSVDTRVTDNLDYIEKVIRHTRGGGNAGVSPMAPGTNFLAWPRT